MSVANIIKKNLRSCISEVNEFRGFVWMPIGGNSQNTSLHSPLSLVLPRNIYKASRDGSLVHYALGSC